MSSKTSLFGTFRKLFGGKSAEEKDASKGESIPSASETLMNHAANIEQSAAIKPSIQSTAKPKKSIPKVKPVEASKTETLPEPSTIEESHPPHKAEKQFFQILEKTTTGAPVFQEDIDLFSETLKTDINPNVMGGTKKARAIDYLCDTYFPNPTLLKLLLKKGVDPKVKSNHSAPLLILINRGFEAFSKGHIDEHDKDFSTCATILAAHGAIREKEDWEDVRSLLPKPTEDGLSKPEDVYIRAMREAIRRGAEVYQDFKKREALEGQEGFAKLEKVKKSGAKE